MDLYKELETRKKMVDEYLVGIFDPIRQPTLKDAMEHLLDAGGKRWRPICAMLGCELMGGAAETAMPFGVAIELIHNFTLVHDDIMDEDELRRGKPTVHKAFSIPTAINAGDGLYSHALEIVTRCDCSDDIFRKLIKEMALTVRAIGEGQQDDMDFEERDDVTLERYFTMIENKTAKIFELAFKGGALIAGADGKTAAALGEFGRYFGISFQLADDCLDILAKSSEMGKPAKSDLKKNKKTLIVVHALNRADPEQKRILGNVLGNSGASEADLERATRILIETDSIDYAGKKAVFFVEKAKGSIAYLPSNAAKDILLALADYNITRRF